MEEGYHIEDWMDLSSEEGEDVILPPQITNILREPAALTINVEEEETNIPEASRLERSIEAQLVPSTSVPSEPTYLLPSSIKSRMIGTDLERVKTLFGISDEYQMRIANPKERVDWRSPS